MIISTTYLRKFFKSLYVFYYLLLSILDFFLFFINPKFKTNNNILLIKLDRYGDFILWNDHFNQILKSFKKKNIFLLCNNNLKEYLKKHYKNITFISCDKKSFLFNIKYRYQKLFFLRKFLFEQVINFHRERDIYYSDCIVKITNSSNKCGSKIHEKGFINNLSNQHYDKLVETREKSHESIYLNEFKKKLFESNYSYKKDLKFKKNKKLSKFKNCVLISSGGSDSKRNISLNKILLSLRISNLSKTKIVILGNNYEKNVINKNYVFFHNNIINLAGKTNFDDFIYLHYLAKVIISNDSASGHLAHYFKKKSFTFLGGGHFNRFFPYPNKNLKKHKYIYKKMKCFNCNWNCLYDNLNMKKYPCIEKVENTFNIIKI